MIKYDSDIKNGYVVNGFYDSSEDYENNTTVKCIEIELIYGINPGFNDELLNKILDTYDHEMRHRYQESTRQFIGIDYNIGNNHTDEYLCNYDEIDAYAINTANELIRYYKDSALDALRSFSKIYDLRTSEQDLITETLYIYCSAANNNSKIHKSLKRLLRKAYKHIYEWRNS